MKAILPGVEVNAGANKIKSDCLDVIILLFERTLFLVN